MFFLPDTFNEVYLQKRFSCCVFSEFSGWNYENTPNELCGSISNAKKTPWGHHQREITSNSNIEFKTKIGNFLRGPLHSEGPVGSNKIYIVRWQDPPVLTLLEGFLENSKNLWKTGYSGQQHKSLGIFLILSLLQYMHKGRKIITVFLTVHGSEKIAWMVYHCREDKGRDLTAWMAALPVSPEVPIRMVLCSPDLLKARVSREFTTMPFSLINPHEVAVVTFSCFVMTTTAVTSAQFPRGRRTGKTNNRYFC